MNKAGIADAVHVVVGGTKTTAEQAVEKVIEVIIGSLKKGEDVSIAGLGIFSVKERAVQTSAKPENRRSHKRSYHEGPEIQSTSKNLKDSVK